MMVVLGRLFLELHKVVSVAFKERTFLFLLVQRAPSQKQPCVYFNPHTNTQPRELRGYGALAIQELRVELVNQPAFSQPFLFQTWCWVLTMQRKRGVLQKLSHG